MKGIKGKAGQTVVMKHAEIMQVQHLLLAARCLLLAPCSLLLVSLLLASLLLLVSSVGANPQVATRTQHENLPGNQGAWRPTIAKMNNSLIYQGNLRR